MQNLLDGNATQIKVKTSTFYPQISYEISLKPVLGLVDSLTASKFPTKKTGMTTFIRKYKLCIHKKGIKTKKTRKGTPLTLIFFSHEDWLRDVLKSSYSGKR